MPRKLKAYNVQARMILVAGITIKAESLEDAIAQSTDLKEIDFVDFHDEFCDGSIKIVGVNEDDSWNTEQDGGQ